MNNLYTRHLFLWVADYAIFLPLYLFIIIAPSYYIPILRAGGTYDQQRAGQILIIALMLIYTSIHTCKPTRHSIPVPGKPINLLLLTVLVAGTLSSYFAGSPRHGYIEVSLFCGLFILSMCLAHGSITHKKNFLLTSTIALFLSAAVYTTGFFSGFVGSYIQSKPLAFPLPFYGFSSVRFFNQYQVWTLPLISLPLFIHRRWKPYAYYSYFFVICLWWVLLFASESRGAVMTSLGALCLTTLIYNKAAWVYLKIQCLSLLIGLCTYIFLFFILPTWVYASAIPHAGILRNNVNDRLYLWEKAYNLILEHPFLGVGPMHYSWVENTRAAHPHNSMLQILVEWGIPAFLILIFITLYGLTKWIQYFNTSTLSRTDAANQAIPIALFCSFIAGATYSLVSGVIVMPLGQLMMAVVAGLMYGVYRTKRPIALRTRKAKPIYQVFALVTVAVLLGSIAPDFIPRLVGQKEFLKKSTITFGPRIWQEGGIPH